VISDTDGNPATRAWRSREDRSILDFVAEDARGLNASLGASDQHKLDEYLYGIRAIEQRIAMTAQRSPDLPEVSKPDGVPENYAEHARLLFDLAAIALQADLTRVITFMMGSEGSVRPYPELGIPEGHHSLTHHDNDPEKIQKVVRINRYHAEQFAYFVERLNGIPQGDRTLLGDSVVLYGSGISDGNVHDHGNLPVVLAGTGGGRINMARGPGGRHIRYEKETPMANLYLAILAAVRVPTDTVGDSTWPLEF
jgi:Protein of unknown function (DUF1552)